jgi:hypothetical protein
LAVLRRATWARVADPEAETLLMAIGAAVLAEGEDEGAILRFHGA